MTDSMQAERLPGADPIRLLIVDDDPGVRDLIGGFLESHAYQVLKADGGPEMRRLLDRHTVDVVILDVMMPGEDGLSLARDLCLVGDVGVIMISALGTETDRIVGLEVGADDYLAKPVSPRELLARIRAVLRRRQNAERVRNRGAVYVFAGWNCDIQRRMLYDPTSVLVTLSQGEFALLHAFLERPGRILSRDQLIDLTLGSSSDAFDRAIDTRVSRLRGKLASRAPDELIRTVRNEGYMFMPKVQQR